MTIEEIDQQIKVLQEKREAILQSGWMPNDGERYYFVNGAVRADRSNFYSSFSYDETAILNGNCYRTKEEAEKRAEQIRAENILRKFLKGKEAGNYVPEYLDDSGKFIAIHFHDYYCSPLWMHKDYDVITELIAKHEAELRTWFGIGGSND